MPRVNIYIRNEDYEKWQSIDNVPQFIHEVVNNYEALKTRRIKQLQQVKTWGDNNVERRRELSRMNMRKWRQIEQNKIKDRAGYTLRNAIKRGEILRQTICESCNGTNKVQAHHPDHNKPLDVLWLCIACHREAHHPKSQIVV